MNEAGSFINCESYWGLNAVFWALKGHIQGHLRLLNVKLSSQVSNEALQRKIRMFRVKRGSIWFNEDL